MKMRSLFFIALLNLIMAPTISIQAISWKDISKHASSSLKNISQKASWPTTQTWLKAGVPCTLAGALGFGALGIHTYKSFCNDKRSEPTEPNYKIFQKNSNNLNAYIKNNYMKNHKIRPIIATLSTLALVAGITMLGCAQGTYLKYGE